MNDQKEKALRRDAFLALHQQHCWVTVAGAAVLGAYLILRFCKNEAVVPTIVLALSLAAVYQWAGHAPDRALRGWIEKANNEHCFADALCFAETLSDALPAMKKKEMAYSLTVTRAVQLANLGRLQEALELAQGFGQTWNSAQKEQLSTLIQNLQRALARQAQREKEQK